MGYDFINLKGAIVGKIYAVANRKGGCSKTTTCGALASGIARLGCKVLLVDMDPQGDSTDWTGFDPSDANTTYEVLMGRCTPEEAIVERKYYDLMPADNSLASIEAELATTQGRELRLREALSDVIDKYDFIVIDTPPQLGLLTIIAFAAVTGGVIVPTDSGKFATKGMRELVETLDNTRKYHNPDARVVGILITRFNPRYNAMKVMKKVTAEFAKYLDAPLYETFIRQSVVIMESQMENVDIFDVKRSNAAVEDYRNFVNEFVDKEGLYTN